MMHQQGGIPPLFLSCSPRLRNDALLSRAVEDFKSGHYADALIAVEYVCRRYPELHIPAMLRAKILETSRPELSAKAWYQAWKSTPDLPILQDAMLRCWLQTGAADSVRDLGPAFLPARCRDGSHAPLLVMLRESGVATTGACWKSGDAIEGMIFTPQDGPATARLLLSNESQQYQLDVPAHGQRFRFASPEPGVWSLALTETDGGTKLLQGSPLVFASAADGSPATAAATHPVTACTEPAQAAVQEDSPLRPIDIIVPVYNDDARTRACITSVVNSLPRNQTPARVVVVDDASPEPALSAWLDQQADAGHITLLRNPRNLGFIETCNRAMRLGPAHDVMLLNADTLVHGDWLDRLRATLYCAPDIASATPWSNNGEISSFPTIARTARAPTIVELARIDHTAAALRKEGSTADMELPACCGFAMLIRRAVLNQVGLLDGVHLVRGYGEEVDWCLRATAAGYRHLLATGVFVAHTGTVSFRFEKTLRVRENRHVIAARYPNYRKEYLHFIKDDPLQAPRAVLHGALEQKLCTWLADALWQHQGAGEIARPVPSPLTGHCQRICVWHYTNNMRHAGKVLALARLIASRPELKLCILIIGDENEALRHTGVVDILPRGNWDETTLLTDAAMVGLSGCSALLVEPGIPVPLHVPVIPLDDAFEPDAWLSDWMAAQVHTDKAPAAKPARKTKTKKAVAV